MRFIKTSHKKVTNFCLSVYIGRLYIYILFLNYILVVYLGRAYNFNITALRCVHFHFVYLLFLRHYTKYCTQHVRDYIMSVIKFDYSYIFLLIRKHSVFYQTLIWLPIIRVNNLLVICLFSIVIWYLRSLETVSAQPMHCNYKTRLFIFCITFWYNIFVDIELAVTFIRSF